MVLFQNINSKEKIPYLQMEFGDYITPDNQHPFDGIVDNFCGEPAYPTIFVMLDGCSNEISHVSSSFGIKITNIGLGMATNLKCTWSAGVKVYPQHIGYVLLKCAETIYLNVFIHAAQDTPCFQLLDGAFLFEYDDLLGNHYCQDLHAKFFVNNGVNLNNCKVTPPRFIGKV